MGLAVALVAIVATATLVHAYGGSSGPNTSTTDPSSRLTRFDVNGSIVDENGSPVNATVQVRCTQGVLQNASGSRLNYTGSTFSFNDVPVESKLRVAAESENVSLNLFFFTPDNTSQRGTAKRSGRAGNTPPHVSIQQFDRPPKKVSLPHLKRTFRYVEVNASGISYQYANVSIHYTDDEVGPDEERLKIAHYTNGRWKYEETHVDTENNLATAEVTSFSPFALVAQNTSYAATLRVYDTRGDGDPSNDQLVITKQLTDAPADGTLADLGHVGTLNRNRTYRVDIQIRPNTSYALDADYFRDTHLSAGTRFTKSDTGGREYLAPDTVVPNSLDPTDAYITRNPDPDYSLAGAVTETGRVDGDTDIAYVEQNSRLHTITQTGNGDGSSWNSEQTVSTTSDTPYAVEAADLDLDGDRDLVVATTKGYIEVYRNDGTGGFSRSTTQAAHQKDYNDLALADIDHDGYPDVVTVSKGYTTELYLNDGTGGFTNPSTIHTANSAATDVATGDFDGDGDLDIASADSEKLYVHHNSAGDGSSWSTETISTSYTVTALAAGDLDRDGTTDVLAGHDKGVVWFEGGTGWTPHEFEKNQGAHDVAAGDLDRDGTTDVLAGLIVGGVKTGSAWYENGGSGTSWTKHDLGSTDAFTVSITDLDGDGDHDALTGEKSESITWWENDGTLTWPSRTVASSLGHAPRSMVAVDLDRDQQSGHLDYYVSRDETPENVWDSLSPNENYSFGLFLTPDTEWTDGTSDTLILHLGHEAGDGWTREGEKSAGAVRTPIRVAWSWNVSSTSYYPTVSTDRDLRAVRPGSTAEFNVTVTNQGAVKDTITLAATPTDTSWNTSLDATRFTLPSGSSATTTLHVTPPGGAAEGDSTDVTLRAESTNDTNSYATTTVTATVVDQYGVSLTSDSPKKKVGRNETATYQISAENLGWSDDTYQFTIQNNTNDNFSATLLDSHESVASGSTGTVTLEVTAPGTGQLPLDTHTTVLATSTNDTSVTDTVTVETRLGAPRITDPKKWHLEFDETWDQPYRTGAADWRGSPGWTPTVWLYDQNEDPVSGATVHYEVRNINDEELVATGDASDNGDGSYSFSFEAAKNDKYWEILVTSEVNGNTLENRRVYYSGASDSGYPVPYRIQLYRFSAGPTMKGGSDKQIIVADLEGHNGGSLPDRDVYIKVLDSSGSTVQSTTTMQDLGDGIYLFNLPGSQSTSGEDYLFRVWTDHSSSATNHQTATVANSYYIRALDQDYNPPLIWDVVRRPLIPSQGENITITARVGDDSGLSTARAEYRLNEGPWRHETMTQTGPLKHEVDIGAFPQDYRLDWRLYAEDINGNGNVTSTDSHWISSPTGNATSAKVFLDQDVYMFGYLKSIRDGIKDDVDGDGVLWPLKGAVSTGSAWEKQIVEKNTIRATALVLDERGKPKQTMDRSKLRFWTVNENGKRIEVTGSDVRNAGGGKYVAVFRGSKRADGSWDDSSTGPDMWGEFDSGKEYRIYVSVDGDYDPEDSTPFLAYGYGDAFYYKMHQLDGGYSRGTHCEADGKDCSPSASKVSARDVHPGDKEMWALNNHFQKNEYDPTCGMCHGVKDVTNWDSVNDSVTHPRTDDSRIPKYSCIDENCHGKGWRPALDETPPADMPVPGFPDGTYNLSFTDEYDTNRTSETWSPSYCRQCHNYPSNEVPDPDGHATTVGCKFCHDSLHDVNRVEDWNATSHGGTPGYAEYGYENCWKDCHQKQDDHAGTVKCEECHEGSWREPEHDGRMRVEGHGKEPGISKEFCGTCHQDGSYEYRGENPPQVPPIKHGDGSSWNTSMGYDRPYWVNQDMSCRYCHGRTYNLKDAQGRVSDWRGENSPTHPLSDTTFCSGCHRANYTSGTHDYQDMVTTYNDSLGLVPPEAFGNPPHAPTGDPRYVDMDTWPIDTQNYTDAYCVDCHSGDENPDITTFVHDVTPDSVPPEVTRWDLDPPDVTTGTDSSVTVTVVIQDPQGILNSTHDPTLTWRIDGTGTGGNVTMTRTGEHTWNGTIPFTAWSSHPNEVLSYRVTGIRDLAENTGTSPWQTELVQPQNNAPPSTPTLTTPTGGETWRGENTVEWTASTDDGATPFTVTYDLDYTSDGTSWSNLTDEHVQTDTTFTWNTSTIDETRTARVRVRAYDGDGYDGSNYSTYATSDTFIIDNEPPRVVERTQTPSDLSNEHDGPIEIEFRITDDGSGVDAFNPPHLYYALDDDSNHSWTDTGALTRISEDTWLGTIPSRNYLGDENKTLRYYLSPLTDNIGNTGTSITWSDDVDDLAGAADLRVAPSRRAILDDPNAEGKKYGNGYKEPLNPWGGSDYWKDESTKVRFYGMLKGKHGLGVSDHDLTFKILNPDGSLHHSETATTNRYGIASISHQMNEATWYGEYTIRVETTYRGIPENSSAGFIYNYWGCANCHNNRNPDQPETDGQNSPYTHGWGGIVNIHRHMYRHETFGQGFTETKCTHCHQSYDGLPGDRRQESRFDDLTSGFHGQRNKKCTFCHKSIDTHRRKQTIPSCFDCHPVYNEDINQIDTTRKVPSSYSNYGDGSDFSVYSWNPEFKGPLTAHTKVYGKRNPDAYDVSKGVPCLLCHGPMHNITKPDPSPDTSNRITEESQCTPCHGSIKRRHPAMDVSATDKTCPDCHTKKPGHSAHNVSASNQFFSSYENFSTGAPEDPDWGLWQRWETAYNESYTHDGTSFDAETCESCHSGPNQPKGVHRLDLDYSSSEDSRDSYFSGDGGSFECTNCHRSKTSGGKQEIHSAHPVSYEESKSSRGGEGCACHDGPLGELPKSSISSGTYRVEAFGTDWTYDASDPQRCTQCHGDWHTDSEYDERTYPYVSRNASWSLRNDTTIDISSEWNGPQTEISSHVSPGTPGYSNCTEPPCHRDTAHEAMAKSTTAERFPHYETTRDGKFPGCDECHSRNLWSNHMSSILGVYGTERDPYPACNTCHFEEVKDQGYRTVPEPGYDR